MIKKAIGEKVRDVLLANPQGLTVRDISKLVDSPMDLVLACLRRTYGCYIADFASTKIANRFHSIWCCVAVPPNATKPLASKLPVEIVDDREAQDAKRRKAQREAAKRERISQALANKRIRKAAKEKPTQPEKPAYKPQKTVWVSVPSWSSVDASA